MFMNLMLLSMIAGQIPIPDSGWTIIKKGVEIQKIDLSKYSEYKGDLYIVRINPSNVKPKIYSADKFKEKPMSAADWCKKYKLNIAINLGMYHKDFKTHVGYMKNGDYINNSKWNNYKSALLLAPTDKNLPYFYIADLDNDSDKKLTEKYKSIVQNLRLIKGNGINVWQKKDEKWPLAAVAQDKSQNMLILFTDTPVTVYDFIQIVLNLNLSITKALYLDGGPPASLSIHYNDINLDLTGNSLSNQQEPIPNIIGIMFGPK